MTGRFQGVRGWTRWVGVGVVVLFVCWPGEAGAQVSAALTGIVTDASGAAIPAANVTATSIETAAVRTTRTDSIGRYQLLELAVGRYQVTVSKDGFQTTVRDGIRLAVGQTAILDLALQVGAVQEQVTVTGDLSPVSTGTTDASGEVAEDQIKNLPLNGRSYDLLTLLNPGVVNFTWE